MKKLNLSLLSFFCILCIVSCEKSSVNNTNDDQKISINIESELSSSIEKLTKTMFESGAGAIDKTKQHAETLEQAIAKFLKTPTQDTLVEAQEKWLEAALSYREFYFYRHIGLVDPKTFKGVNKLDYQIASFPIQPGYLDKVGEYKYSGLVHDIGVPINQESLTKHHGLTDVADVVLGFYAIEFLLFNSGEKRQANDFVEIVELDGAHKERGFKSTNEIPNNRRRQLLDLQTKILISDLDRLKDNWASDGEGSVRNTWEQIYFGRKTGIANQSIAVGLSKIMLDINELNQKEVEKPNISNAIKMRGFAMKQKFIGNALKSIKSNTQFLSYEKKTNLEERLSKAIEMTSKSEIEKNGNEEEHWKALFSAVKDAGDIAMR